MAEELGLGILFTGRVHSSLRNISKTINSNVTQAIQSVNKEVVKGKPKADAYSASLGRVTSAFKTLAAFTAAGVTIGIITSLFTGGIKAIMEYDQALHNLKAITEATDEELALMGTTIKEVAAITKFSASEIAQGMVILGQAGFTAAESVETIGAVANLATGTLSSFKSSADLVTTALRAFTNEELTATKVSDIFANAVNSSKLTVDGLRTVFNFLGPAANLAGISLKEAATAAGILANSGIRFSTIGTGMRQVIARLVAPSKQMRDAFREAGADIARANPLYNDLVVVIEELSKVITDGAVAFELFKLRGATPVAALVSQTAEKFRILEEKIDRNTTALKQATEQSKGMVLTWKNLKDNLGLTAIEFSKVTGLTTLLKGSLKLLRDAIKQVNKEIVLFRIKLDVLISVYKALFKITDESNVSTEKSIELLEKKKEALDREKEALEASSKAAFEKMQKESFIAEIKKKQLEDDAREAAKEFNLIKKRFNEEISGTKKHIELLNAINDAAVDQEVRTEAEGAVERQKNAEFSFQRRLEIAQDFLNKVKKIEGVTPEIIRGARKEILNIITANDLQRIQSENAVTVSLKKEKEQQVKDTKDARKKESDATNKRLEREGRFREAASKRAEKAEERRKEFRQKILDDEFEQIKAGQDKVLQAQKETDDKRIALSKSVNEQIAGNMTDGIFDFIEGTKSAKEAFKDFARSTLKWLAQIILRQSILNLIGGATGTGGIGGFITGLLTPASVKHKGGMVGDITTTRMVPRNIFANAQRLKSGEVPTILDKDELVLNVEQQKGIANVGKSNTSSPINTYQVTVPITISSGDDKDLLDSLRVEIESTALRVLEEHS